MRKPNEYIIEGDIAKIVIIRTNGETYHALIDTEDLPKVSKYKWFVNTPSERYIRVWAHKGTTRADRKILYMHNLILEVPSPNVVDHINGNPLNNRKGNLRQVTRAENLQNRKGAAINNLTSGVRGVSWCRERSNWEAYCSVNGKRYNLGRYNSVAEAESVVKEARARLLPFSKEGIGCLN